MRFAPPNFAPRPAARGLPRRRPPTWPHAPFHRLRRPRTVSSAPRASRPSREWPSPSTSLGRRSTSRARRLPLAPLVLLFRNGRAGAIRARFPPATAAPSAAVGAGGNAHGARACASGSGGGASFFFFAAGGSPLPVAAGVAVAAAVAATAAAGGGAGGPRAHRVRAADGDCGYGGGGGGVGGGAASSRRFRPGCESRRREGGRRGRGGGGRRRRHGPRPGTAAVGGG